MALPGRMCERPHMLGAAPIPPHHAPPHGAVKVQNGRGPVDPRAGFANGVNGGGVKTAHYQNVRCMPPSAVQNQSATADITLNSTYIQLPIVPRPPNKIRPQSHDTSVPPRGIPPLANGQVYNGGMMRGGVNGMRPGTNGIWPGVDGMRPGANGMWPGVDGMRPGTNGIQPGVDGMRPGANGMQPGVDGMRPPPAPPGSGPASGRRPGNCIISPVTGRPVVARGPQPNSVEPTRTRNGRNKPGGDREHRRRRQRDPSQEAWVAGLVHTKRVDSPVVSPLRDRQPLLMMQNMAHGYGAARPSRFVNAFRRLFG
ncbi:hypothetical protein DQ04_07821000 [Trypanosoma grayi]|uniref:hypothetical protein n=1 Tax=Trypanosoma grayi TaxID=71804 RepID=UPI0004F3FEBA|nr:hypothetical protein DQ04_07821000 [Trypanosoma grayi]KEG08178.1 hypothetical protein DQ04_07821000 [Trypanosoma grayi]